MASIGSGWTTTGGSTLSRRIEAPSLSGYSPTGSASSPVLPTSQAEWTVSPTGAKLGWSRNGAGKWPGIRKAELLPPPQQRVRTLICSCPSHFCKESLIIVPAGAEPIQAPYRMSACIDLRGRKDAVRNKSVYLVAYDLEKLRTFSSSGTMGVDPFQASNSWIARECICSEVVPIRQDYGEVQITLNPPDYSDGDVHMILRVVVVGDQQDQQDWRPIGDCVMIRVEPRVCREDKKLIRTMQKSIEVFELAAEETQKALNESHDKYLGMVDEANKVKAELKKTQFESRELQRIIEGLHSSIESLQGELKLSADTGAQAKTLLHLRRAVDDSKTKQLKIQEQSKQEVEMALSESSRVVALKEAEVKSVQSQLEGIRSEVAQEKKNVATAKTAHLLQAAMKKSHKQQVEIAKGEIVVQKDSVDKLQKDLNAAKQTTSKLQSDLMVSKLAVKTLQESEAKMKADLGESDRIKSELDKAKAENKALAESEKALKEELDKTKLEQKSLQESEQKAKSAWGKALIEKKKLTADLEASKQDSKMLEEMANKMTEETKAARAEAEQTKQELETLKSSKAGT